MPAAECGDTRRMRLGVLAAVLVMACRGGSKEPAVIATAPEPWIAPPTPAGRVDDRTCNHDHLGIAMGDIGAFSGVHPLRRERVRGRAFGAMKDSDTTARSMCDALAPVRACYGKGIRNGKRLDGHLDLFVAVGNDARIQSAQRMSGSLDDAELVGCITKGLVGAQMDPSLARKGIEYQLQLSSRIGNPGVNRTVTPPLELESDEASNCYEKHLHADPDLAGDLELTWVAQPDGKITDAKVVSTTLKNKELVDCVVAGLPKRKLDVKKRTEVHETLTFAPNLNVE